MNLSNVTAGTYTLVAMDQNGCTDTLGPLTVPGDIALNLDSANMQVLPALCGQNNGAINGIAPSGGTAPYSFLWSNQSVNLNPSGLSPGSYTLYVTDANGCMDSITGIVVGAFGGPSIDTSQMVINPIACDGTLGSITGITSPSPGVSYGWSNQGNTADISNLTSGVYQLTLTDVNGCTSSYNFVVNQNNPIIIDESQALVTNATCLMNGSITGLNVSGGTNNYTYSWQPGNLSTLNISNLPAGTSYVLTVTDANGCSDTSNLYTIGTPNYPVASFTYSPAIPNLGDSVTFTNTSSNYTSEQWINAGITVNQPSPWSYSYTAGTFQVTLTVTNNEGCTDTMNAFVTVYDQIQVPNVFSPNNDMINDVLTIQSLKPGTSLTILNRWGNVVYYSEFYGNNWDGKDQNGNDVTEGVYTLILTDLQKTTTSYYFIHLTR